MKKLFTTFISVLCVLFILWFAASWIDIVADNCEPNPVHSEYNLFVLALKNN